LIGDILEPSALLKAKDKVNQVGHSLWLELWKHYIGA